jgi:hypothetical protein
MKDSEWWLFEPVFLSGDKSDGMYICVHGLWCLFPEMDQTLQHTGLESLQ